MGFIDQASPLLSGAQAPVLPDSKVMTGRINAGLLHCGLNCPVARDKGAEKGFEYPITYGQRAMTPLWQRSLPEPALPVITHEKPAGSHEAEGMTPPASGITPERQDRTPLPHDDERWCPALQPHPAVTAVQDSGLSTFPWL